MARRVCFLDIVRQKGINRSTLNDLFWGKGNPTETTLTAIADYLEIDPGRLIALRKQAREEFKRINDYLPEKEREEVTA